MFEQRVFSVHLPPEAWISSGAFVVPTPRFALLSKALNNEFPLQNHVDYLGAM